MYALAVRVHPAALIPAAAVTLVVILFALRMWVAAIGCSLALVFLFLLLPQGGGREFARSAQCANNLKQIGLALHLYEAQYGCYPPAFVADKSGRPMHSWRVLILPFLEHQDLYDRYRFDEPWNSPHNLQVANSRPDLFHCRGGYRHTSKYGDPDEESPMTSYVAVLGPNTAWRGSKPVRNMEFRDGTQASILVVEVVDSGIIWTEPRDLHRWQMAPTINSAGGQGIRSTHPGWANACFADGTVHQLRKDLPAETLGLLLDIDDGEVVPEGAF